MCLIAWNWQPDSQQPLLLLANRDEFFMRPTQPLHWWQHGLFMAGRDLHGGGSWLGVSRDGRLAALTNYRDPLHQRADAPSRGKLVTDFLEGSLSATDYLAQLMPRAQDYNPFNLLLLDGQQLLGFESRQARSFVLQPGIQGVSNAGFNTPWPKLLRLTAALSRQRPTADTETLMSLLADDTIAPDTLLPQTGITLERERLLSAAFIRSSDYGTRASSVIRLTAQGMEFSERSFNAQGTLATQQLRLATIAV